MRMPWESAIESVTSLVSEFIADPDKAAEIGLELEKLKNGIRSQLLQTTTTPRTDAFVKLLVAFNNLVIPLLRPLGGFCMTCFGAYCHYEGIAIDGAVHAIFDGAFPAWGASRHIQKKNETGAKNRKPDNSWDED